MSAPAPRTFTTGGMSTEFDKRIAAMLENEKLNLLTSSVTVATRGQYMYCWRRRAQFRACSGLSRWITDTRPGRGNNLVDFLVWGHKLLGLQHSALAKRYYAIRYIHIAEGYDDFHFAHIAFRVFSKKLSLEGGVRKNPAQY